MRYFSNRHLFLFDIINEYTTLLNDLEDDTSYKSSIESIQKFFSTMANNFLEIIFKSIYQYVHKLKLNIHNNSDNISVYHIKNIYSTILSNASINKVLFDINLKLKEINSLEKFDIKHYKQIVDLLEELDFMCILEIYSYLLNEDLESVLNFILNKMTESVTYSNDESLEIVNERFLRNVEHKLRLFKKLYNNEDLSLIVKNDDHIIYKINNVLKIVQLIK